MDDLLNVITECGSEKDDLMDAFLIFESNAKSRRRERKRLSAPNQMLVIHAPSRKGEDVKTISMLL